MSFVIPRGTGWRIDPKQKGSSLIPNTLNLRHIEGALAGCRGGCLVDAGAGAMPFAPLYRDRFEKTIAFDHEDSLHPNPDLTFHAGVEAIPLEDACADVVLCTEVLEHVPDPRQAMIELARILKPGGLLILTTPFLEGVHEAPYDFYRYTNFGLQRLCEDSGLAVESIVERGGLFGLRIHMAAQIQSKFWKFVAKLLRLPLDRGWNPLVWLGIRLPQYAYLTVSPWCARQSSGPLARLFRWTRHYCLGYLTLARKPAAP